MENSISPAESPDFKLENPTPPRDLRVLAYIARPGKETDLLQYYAEVIIPYLEGNGVKDAVAWTIQLGELFLFAIATAPTIPPWFDAPELRQLDEFADRSFPFEFTRRRDLDMHLPEDTNNQ